MNANLLTKGRGTQAILECERRYQTLLASVSDYVYSVKLDKGHPGSTEHSLGCQAVTGYTPAEFAADPGLWYRMIHDADRPAVLAQIEGLMQGKSAPPLEHRIIHKCGAIRWIRNTRVPSRDGSGRLVGYDGLVADITEQKHAEERLQAILDYSPAVIALKDLAGRYLVINRHFEEVFRIRREDAVGKTAHDLFPAETAALLRRHDEQVIVTRAPLKVEEAVPGGSEPRTYLSVRFPLLEAGGAVSAICVIATDITDHKRAEMSLRKSQERLTLVIQGANDGIWDWDLATDEVYFSPRWKSMLGYADAEIANHFSSWQRLLHPDDLERALQHLKAYLAGEAPNYELEHRLLHKDGSYRWILARGVALRDQNGKPIRMAGSHVDLTDRKQAEERLQRAYAELAAHGEAMKMTLQELKASHEELKATQLQLIQSAKLESVGTLAAGVAHEVKNPLQTILMGLDYLGSSLCVQDAAIASVLTDMRDGVRRANTIIGELLQFSRARDFQFGAEDLNSLVERCFDLLRGEIIASRTTVVRNLAADLPRVLIDRGKMEQVLLNLVINALQAMDNGGMLSVSTRSARFGQDYRRPAAAPLQFQPDELLVVAELQDTGPGIAEPDLARIFDPFFTTKSAGAGTGLGLYVAKKIVEIHGGAIELCNDPLGGVRATLVLKTAKEYT